MFNDIYNISKSNTKINANLNCIDKNIFFSDQKKIYQWKY